MQKERSFWSEWAQFLQRTELTDLAAAVLEATGPVHVFLAQVVYAGRPFLSQLVPVGRLEALAGIFENAEESRSFVDYLRTERAGLPVLEEDGRAGEKKESSG